MSFDIRTDIELWKPELEVETREVPSMATSCPIPGTKKNTVSKELDIFLLGISVRVVLTCLSLGRQECAASQAA
jgi:hypothetical protein